MTKDMKYIKYFALAAALMLGAAACQKHVIEFAESDSVKGKAQFQIIYAEPIAATTANRIDSVFVNGQIYNTINMPQKLTVNGIIPYPNGYYVAPAGQVNLKFYRGKDSDGKSKLVYDQTFTLSERKQQVIVYNLEAAPVILDDEYPYTSHSTGATPATFDTDSLVSYRFINMLFQSPGVPYAGKVQYQWSNNSTRAGRATVGDWHNIGSPVGFGEQTIRDVAVVHKTVFNSSGSQELQFRALDEEGNMIGNGDYWTAFIGRVNTHMMRGCVTGSPSAAYTQFINNVQ